MWRDSLEGYGPLKKIYNRFVRWSKIGVFNRIFAELASDAGEPDAIMIDATPSRPIARRPALREVPAHQR